MRALGIFAKAPIPGRVKTRLAADVGPSAAAEVYWQMGFKIVATTAGLGYRTVLWFTPADEGAYVRERNEDFVRILALESVRNRVVVVGEDLGTVDPAIRSNQSGASR